ncbi:MAG: hypothetical protein QOJ49_947 [Actinomycetota bacterium]|nr:hypothetical protein [Actinomycetota bacterium]MDQ1643165.1 hypothetical protein [Actinomycetota bacterium]
MVVTTLLLAHVFFGLLALLVLGFVSFPYRGRTAPKARRLSEAVASVAERVDPGVAPPLGVLSTPEKSRRVSKRFERAEHAVLKVVSAGRS